MDISFSSDISNSAITILGTNAALIIIWYYFQIVGVK